MIGLHNKYKDDYDHSPGLDKRGKFKDHFYYIGDLYVLPFDEKNKKKTYLPCIGFMVAALAVLILQGMLNQPSSRTIWVVMPYIFQFLPVLFFGVGIVEYATCPIRMQREQYDKGVQRMRHCAIGFLVLSVISGMADVVFLVGQLSGYEQGKGREFIYFALHFASVAIAFLFARYYNRIFAKITVEKNH